MSAELKCVVIVCTAEFADTASGNPWRKSACLCPQLVSIAKSMTVGPGAAQASPSARSRPVELVRMRGVPGAR